MIRILHVMPAVAPRYGGPSTAIAGLCDGLNSIPGVRAEVAATDADGPVQFDATRWPVANTPLHLFPAEGPERYKRSRGLAEWLWANASQYDLIHTHAAWNYPTFAACKAARHFRLPLVYRPCGTLSAYTWSLKRPLKWAYWLARERRNVASAAAFHCTSEAEAAEVRAHRTARGEIHVIPLGVDKAAFDFPVNFNTLRQRCGPAADGKPIILFLSRLHPKKGIVDILLPALAELKTPAFLAIVGGADQHDRGYEAVVQATIARFGLSDRVALLGEVSAADRWNLFDGADVFVLPSHVENFGIVVVEALARGCPVVTTPGTATSEYVTAVNAGAVCLRNPTAFAAAIATLLRNPDRVEAGLRGRAFVHDRLTWGKAASSLASLYAGLLTRQT